MPVEILKVQQFYDLLEVTYRGPNGRGVKWMSPDDLVGAVATVEVDGKTFSGRVYHVRENGWFNVETPAGHIASGPLATL